MLVTIPIPHLLHADIWILWMSGAFHDSFRRQTLHVNDGDISLQKRRVTWHNGVDHLN